MDMKHRHFMQSEVVVIFLESILTVSLKTNDHSVVNIFRLSLANQKLPQDLQEIFSSITQLFEFLQKRENYIVNPNLGTLLLLLQGNDKKTVQLPMQKVQTAPVEEFEEALKIKQDWFLWQSNKKSQEKEKNEEQNNQIKPNDGIKKLRVEIEVLKVEMQEFKKKFDEKKEQIQKMPIKNHYNSRYQGQVNNEGKGEGFGILKFTSGQWNGDRYQGQWINAKRKGKGIYYCCDGDRFEGEWNNDKRQGKGIYYCCDGDRQQGYWLRDKSEGEGIYFCLNGDYEQGNYLNGQPHGRAVIYHRDGRVQDRQYKNGQIIFQKLLK